MSHPCSRFGVDDILLAVVYPGMVSAHRPVPAHSKCIGDQIYFQGSREGIVAGMAHTVFCL